MKTARSLSPVPCLSVFSRQSIKIKLVAAAAWAVAASSAQAAITHRYAFNDGTANDSVGAAHGTLTGTVGGGPTVAGGNLNLNNPDFSPLGSTKNFLTLPPSILPASGSVTIEIWFRFTGSGFFTESWAFSDNANDTNPPDADSGQYFMHTISNPQGGPTPAGGGSSVAQTTAGFGGGAETRAFGTTPGIGAFGGGYLDDGGTYMSATVIDASAGTLSYYVTRLSDNLGGLQHTIPAIPLSSYAFTNAWIGRSPFTADNATSGAVNEFRIYNHAKSANEIAADIARGPDAVPEPTSTALAAGVALLAAARRRR